MRKLLFLAFMFSSFASFGQFLNYTNINGRYKWIAGKFDSTFTLPSGTTPSLRTGGGTGPGALFYSTTDSTVYEYTGSQWRPLHGSDTGRIQIAYVRNTTASIMTTGQVVYINGSTGNVPTVALAINKQDSTSAMTFGFVRGNIAVNGFGWITTFGPIDGINTNAYTEGEVIYLDSIAGQFTHSKPQAPYHMVTLGYIIKKAGNGIIFTKIQNGYELEELHNVNITTPVLNKSVLIYDSTKSLWVDTTVSAAGLGLGGSGTTNYLSKWTSSSALGNSLVFDNGTNVGIGTATPSAKLEINGGTLNVIGSGTSVSEFRSNGIVAIDMTSNLSDDYKFRTLVAVSGDVTQTAINNLSVNSGGYFGFGGGGSEKMRLTSSGRLLIGTTTESTYELDVVGDIRSTLDANINGLTVGKGGGSVATNTAVGVSAINATATGTVNTAIGYRSLEGLTTGSNNTAVGNLSLYRNTTAIYNTAIGSNASQAITTGRFNTSVGVDALYSAVSGEYNTMVGIQSGYNVTGNYNTGVGVLAARGITTGIYNTFIGANDGSYAGSGITTGNYNVIIGSNLSGLSSSLSNTIILADGQGNQRLYINSSAEAAIGTTPVTGYRLNLNGNLRINGTTLTAATQTSYAINLGNGSLDLTFGSDASRTYIQSWNGKAISFQSQGNNVLIGTTTDAGYKLDVNGTARVSGNTVVSGTLTLDNTSDLYGPLRVGDISRTQGQILINSTSIQDIIASSGGRIRFQSGTAEIGMATSGAARSIRFGTTGGSYFGGIYPSGNFEVGWQGADASDGSIFRINSTTKGFLPPRMTGLQAESIATPATGLLVYANNGNGTTITSTGWWGYDGTTWVKLN